MELAEINISFFDALQALKPQLAHGRRPADQAGLSDLEKAIIAATCQRFVDEVLKPRNFLPVIRPTEFNYPVDILGKWHGNRYRSSPGVTDQASRRTSARSLTARSRASTG